MPRPTTSPARGKKPKHEPAVVCHLQEDEDTGELFYKLHRILAKNLPRWMDNHPDDVLADGGYCPPVPTAAPFDDTRPR